MKLLTQVAGALVEFLTPTTSAGPASAGQVPGLDASGRLDTSFLPTGIGADTVALQASEALAAGDFVNVWDSAGSARVRKADASTSGKEAHGFVLAAVVSGTFGTVFFEGTNSQQTSLTPGRVYLSSTTPGRASNTVPSGVGQVVQLLGVATSATSVNAETHQPITLA